MTTQVQHPSNDRHIFHMTAHSLIASPSKKGKPTARARKRLADAPPLEFHITNLAHDGRGVAVYDADNATHNPDKAGKKVFISFALPGETVLVKMTNSKKNFEEGDALQVVNHPHP
ncbi:TRAM domain-containing protein, partial [Moraxella catarrhalis]